MSQKCHEINIYLEQKLAGMSQQELIVFLYDSSLKLMEEARTTIKAGDVVGTHEKLTRARNIFIHLLGTLNIEAGGDLARKLSSLYAFFIEKITVANVTKDIRELDDIMPIICGIRDAWAGIPDREMPSDIHPQKKLEMTQAVSLEV